MVFVSASQVERREKCFVRVLVEDFGVECGEQRGSKVGSNVLTRIGCHCSGVAISRLVGPWLPLNLSIIGQSR